MHTVPKTMPTRNIVIVKRLRSKKSWLSLQKVRTYRYDWNVHHMNRCHSFIKDISFAFYRGVS